jgi:hypothetical protein
VGVPETLAFALSLIKQAVIYLGSLPGGVLWLRGRRKRKLPVPPEAREEREGLVDLPLR